MSVLTFTARLIPTPGSVSLTPSHDRTLNFISSITSERYKMRVSCRDSWHGSMIWQCWFAAVDGLKRREQASKAREFNSKIFSIKHNSTKCGSVAALPRVRNNMQCASAYKMSFSSQSSKLKSQQWKVERSSSFYCKAAAHSSLRQLSYRLLNTNDEMRKWWMRNEFITGMPITRY